MTTGLGISFPCSPTQTWVMTFLSALGTPIARRFEIWIPGTIPGTMAFQSGTCEKTPGLPGDYEGMSVASGQGIVGQTFQTRIPAIIESTADEPAKLKSSLDAAGLSSAIAIPVLATDGQPKAVVAWYF